jgi:hypothetical protein
MCGYIWDLDVVFNHEETADEFSKKVGRQLCELSVIKIFQKLT